MHLKTRNVNTAWRELITGLHEGRIPTEVQSSRAGEVLVVEEPVILTYEKPRERVLFSAARDANPFFHLYEALWMLAGRNDVRALSYYNGRMKEFSDDGNTFNAAYGERWRRVPWYGGTELDQLGQIVKHLSRNPISRRAVLTMWDIEKDLVNIEQSKDLACNTHAYFAIEDPGSGPRRLNLTVCNRSNDLVWGMLGANVVHFSILQEYLACRLGLEVGVYNQFTNNLHVYTALWDANIDRWLGDMTSEKWGGGY